jgi:hypothetical protein
VKLQRRRRACRSSGGINWGFAAKFRIKLSVPATWCILSKIVVTKTTGSRPTSNHQTIERKLKHANARVVCFNCSGTRSMLVNLGQDHGETFCLTSNCLIDAAIRPEAGRPCADDQDGIGHDIAPFGKQLPLLLRRRVVEFSVVERQTTLRRNAGDVHITMLPTDIAPGIEVARMELLGGAVIDAADI